MKVEQLETPALILNLDIFEKNLATMKEMIKGTGMKMRPHYKTTKCPWIAHRQIEDGAKGITCAKLGEAEDLISAGIKDVLIANQIVEQSKLDRVAYLAGCCHLTICVDSIENIHALNKAAGQYGTIIHCLVEYRVGNRCGVYTKEEAYELAAEIEKCDNLTFDGLQAYAGHLSHEQNYEVRKIESEKFEILLSDVKNYIENRGIPVREVSGTSTGTVEFRGKDTVFTEVQAGSYVFMDTAYGELGLEFQNSLFVLTTVLSVQEKQVVTDAGRKSIGLDQTPASFVDFKDYPIKTTEEHSQIPIENSNLKTGDKLLMIPGHCCTTINIHEQLYLARNGEIVDRIPISGRGKSI